MVAAKIFEPGERYGRLVVTARRVGGEPYVQCDCECGRAASIPFRHLARGTQSCGCLRSEVTVKRLTTHGMSKTRIYLIWADMVGRCTRETHARWADYGGRGITVCARWRDFANFYADMGDRPDRRSLDRIDNDGPYSPENCRWATFSEQRLNTRPRTLRPKCMRGHRYTKKNTRFNKKTGARVCRACAREAARQFRASRAVAA